jgi:riboflavin kinase / FMN adenylyltransferase
MKVIHNLLDAPAVLGPTAVTIGNFDGVHLAHRELFHRVVARARELSVASAAITFEPHPARILHPSSAPALLTPLAQKIRLVEQEGLDLLVVLAFTRELSQLTPAEFVRKILVEEVHAAAVCVGSNFHFGRGKSGDAALLAELGTKEGFAVETLPILNIRGERVSSSRIRQLLSEGDPELACRLLGRPFSVSGPVMAGLGVGRRQTVPTLNIAPGEQQMPKVGVYVTRTLIGASAHESVTNVGHKPTFGDHPLAVESYLLDFQGEIGAREIEVEFLRRLRDEIKFEDSAALKAQIQKDVQRARKYFRLRKLLQNRNTQRLAK